MQQKRFEFILEAATPIAHHQETIGNVSILMRKKVRQVGGSFAMVPYITGDTMRHGLREASSWALLDAAGLDELSEPALRLLFAGGMVTGSSPSVKLSQWREILELVPPLALLGGCAQNRIHPGLMQVDEATLICDESAHAVPAWAVEAAGETSSSRHHVEEVTRVRMDPTLDSHRRSLLDGESRERLEGKLEDHEDASERDDPEAKAGSRSSLMPRSIQRIVQGSLFYWSVCADIHTELQADTLMVILATFLHHPVVGGKQGTGHGRLRVVEAREGGVAPWSERSETLNFDPSASSRFRDHVAERRDAIADFLREVRA